MKGSQVKKERGTERRWHKTRQDKTLFVSHILANILTESFIRISMTRLTTGPSTTLFTDPKPNKRLKTELRTPEGKKKEVERGEKEGKREGRKRRRRRETERFKRE